jgi:urease beta subunit
MTSQPQTVMLGNQIVKVQSLNQIQQKVNSQPNASGSNVNQEGQRPIILGSAIKLMKVSLVLKLMSLHCDVYNLFRM